MRTIGRLQSGPRGVPYSPRRYRGGHVGYVVVVVVVLDVIVVIVVVSVVVEEQLANISCRCPLCWLEAPDERSASTCQYWR